MRKVSIFVQEKPYECSDSFSASGTGRSHNMLQLRSIYSGTRCPKANISTASQP